MMDASSSGWLLILLALVAANLPFYNERLLAVLPIKGKPGWRKPFAWRLLELVLLYFAVGFAGLALEARIGAVFPQSWEFYAISACFFVVLAFPGFVLRYLRRRTDPASASAS